MSEKTRTEDLPEFDMTHHLPDDQAIAEYLSIVLEEDDPGALADALGTIARARGMTEIANASGMTREALYKALRPNAQPRSDTTARVCRALGVRMRFEAVARHRRPRAGAENWEEGVPPLPSSHRRWRSRPSRGV